MRFIDEQGKVFGKINVIDFIIIVFVILALIVVVKIVFLQPKEIVYATIQICEKSGNNVINCGSVPYYMSNAVNKGDNIKSGGKVVLEILNINSLDVNLEKEGESRKDVLLEVRMKVNKKTDGLYFKGQVVKIGSPVFFSTQDINIAGVVTKIGEQNISEQLFPKIVLVNIKGEKQCISDSISVGDKEITGKGIILAEVIEKQVSDAEIQVITESGDVLKKFSPIYKDIKLKVKISAENREDQLIFRNDAVKIGKSISFNFPKVSVKGVITELI